ncbi:hypothetical protein [Simkania negevensis]|uniref:Uncharacterized protein n=1 Tax=Simkania negevensis (strain ATCC VR-1471 / DSM 27360 / Z) TaxID=331113 RepID=F8L5V0_SIMNZ|nr:hypothetical protein [Simkania negevensis]CCB88092.1 unknown protein [Simkania negevensis Z]
MTAQVANLIKAIDTPYVKPEAEDLYDLSEGGNYSLHADFISWGMAFAFSLFVITKALPYMGWKDPLPLTLIDTLAIGAMGTTSATLTKRVVGFGKDEKTDVYAQRSYGDYLAFAGYVATALFVVPRVTQVAYETMTKVVWGTLLPPVLFNAHHTLSLNAMVENMVTKVKNIHKDYSAHHPKIMKLSEEKQKEIWGGMQALQLEPPKVIQNKDNPFFKDFHPTDHIFVHSDPKEYETSEWLKEKANTLLKAVNLSPLAPLKEADDLETELNLKKLNLVQLQWIVLSICYSSELKLSAADFNKLVKRAKEINDVDSTGLVDALKKAETVENLKLLVQLIK